MLGHGPSQHDLRRRGIGRLRGWDSVAETGISLLNRRDNVVAIAGLESKHVKRRVYHVGLIKLPDPRRAVGNSKRRYLDQHI